MLPATDENGAMLFVFDTWIDEVAEDLRIGLISWTESMLFTPLKSASAAEVQGSPVSDLSLFMPSIAELLFRRRKNLRDLEDFLDVKEV